MRSVPRAALALLLALPPGLARAQTLKEVDARLDAVAQAWERTPLTARRAIFVAAAPKLYGAYEERASNVFRPGEPLLTYIEPVGYLWHPVGDGGYRFGVALDFVVKRADGQILGGRERFLDYAQTSRYRNQELMVNVTLTLNGLAPGDYILVYTLHDVGGDKTGTVEQRFRIAS